VSSSDSDVEQSAEPGAHSPADKWNQLGVEDSEDQGDPAPALEASEDIAGVIYEEARVPDVGRTTLLSGKLG
jgi:hypothetical protein